MVVCASCAEPFSLVACATISARLTTLSVADLRLVSSMNANAGTLRQVPTAGLAAVTLGPALTTPRRRMSHNGAARATSVAFLVVGTSGEQPAPAFEQLLRGVTDAARENHLALTFAF